VSATFGETAARLAGVAGLLFGWRPQEFWNVTPDELASLHAAMQPSEIAPPSRAELCQMMKEDSDG